MQAAVARHSDETSSWTWLTEQPTNGFYVSLKLSNRSCKPLALNPKLTRNLARRLASVSHLHYFRPSSKAVHPTPWPRARCPGSFGVFHVTRPRQHVLPPDDQPGSKQTSCWKIHAFLAHRRQKVMLDRLDEVKKTKRGLPTGGQT